MLIRIRTFMNLDGTDLIKHEYLKDTNESDKCIMEVPAQSRSHNVFFVIVKRHVLIPWLANLIRYQY